MPCQWFKFPNNEHSSVQLSYVKTTILAREPFNHFSSAPTSVLKDLITLSEAGLRYNNSVQDGLWWTKKAVVGGKAWGNFILFFILWVSVKRPVSTNALISNLPPSNCTCGVLIYINTECEVKLNITWPSLQGGSSGHTLAKSLVLSCVYETYRRKV